MATKKSTADINVAGGIEVTPYKQKRGEEYMSDGMCGHFRGILIAWKERLMKDMDDTVEHLQTEQMTFPDPVDRASQEEGFALELRTRDREWKLIKKIEQSLADLDSGTYGFCEDCGADIGLRRLEARPTAVKCIDCKTYQEIREKQEGS
ncbi:MAG: RNA polymerase-binding protein DksA [Gammaproteobacteria bacterium]|nr:RNA polymerase-binding protein DksA [Gammaproteobacteria bacterium]